MKSLGLFMIYCWGQGFDDARNMGGRIFWSCSSNCSSHFLNLCVASSCQSQVIKNMMEKVRVISEFFNYSPKRFQVLQSNIKEMLPKSTHIRLIDVCRIRWIARIDCRGIMVELYSAVLATLKIIKMNEDTIAGTMVLQPRL